MGNPHKTKKLDLAYSIVYSPTSVSSVGGSQYNVRPITSQGISESSWRNESSDKSRDKESSNDNSSESEVEDHVETIPAIFLKTTRE